MTRNNNFLPSRGFSLIEVLVAVAILSFGLLALATLQVALVRASTEAKAQSEALALGKEMLEDSRTYTDLAGYQALTNTNDTVTVGGVTYTRTRTVTRYVYNQDVDNDGILNESGDQAFQSTTTKTGATPTSPSGFVANNEFKVVNVDTTWPDANGATQTISLTDASGAISPSDSTLVTKTATTTAARKIPVIINDPAADNMVIPIAIGNGANSAATNPKPQIVIGTSTVETQFDVLTYAALSGGTATAQQRVETVMVGCTCDFGTAPGSTARGKRPTYWDGTRYVVPIATTYSPPAGVDSASVNLQSTRCDICCRDHHDPVGTTGALFSPLLATKVSGTVTAAHPHYLNKSAGAPATTGTYKEACRLIRIDGQWRVAADLNNDYFALLATGDGTTAATYVPDTTSVVAGNSVTGTTVTGAVARYQKFVIDYLTGRFTTPTPSAGTEQAIYNTVGAVGTSANPYTKAAGDPYYLRNPTSISINQSDLVGKWLHSRGMYVDYLEQDAVNAITDAKASTSCNVDSATLSNCILKLLPFTSINLTEIADWTSADGTKLSVTNNDYSTSLTYGYPVRGKTTSNSTPATVVITTKARHTNSGLLDLSFDSISPSDDLATPNPAVAAGVKGDLQSFVIGGGSPPAVAGNGTFTVTPVTYTGTSSLAMSYFTTGTASSISCTGVAAPFTCNVQNGSASTGLDVAGGISLDVGGYNHQQNVSNTTTKLSNCTPTGGAVGNLNSDQATNAPGVLQPYTGSVCKNYAVTAVTSTTPSPGTITWAAAPSSLGDGRVNPYPGEVTRIYFTGSIASSNAWVTGTSYAVGNIVTNAGTTYTAAVAHTAGATFAADLAAAKWTARSAISVAVTFDAGVANPQTASSCSYSCGQLNGTNCKNNKPTTFTAIFPACP